MTTLEGMSGLITAETVGQGWLVTHARTPSWPRCGLGPPLGSFLPLVEAFRIHRTPQKAQTSPGTGVPGYKVASRPTIIG